VTPTDNRDAGKFAADIILCAEVSVEVASLSCSGTVRAIRAGMSMPKKPWTFSLIIDIDKKTATVNDLPPVPIIGDTSKNIIVFMASRQTSNYGVRAGRSIALLARRESTLLKTGYRYSWHMQTGTKTVVNT
jgi:hypothetical protein